MEYISSVHPLDVTYLVSPFSAYPKRGRDMCIGIAISSFSSHRLYAMKLQFLLPQCSLSHLLWRAANAKNPRKASFPSACQLESRQYLYSLHYPSTVSLQKTHLCYSLVLASSREKLPMSIGAAPRSPPSPDPALPYRPS